MKLRTLFKTSLTAVALVLSFLLGASTLLAQSTAFTYQGRLSDGGAAANGNYDLQFALWDSLSGGTQIGSTQALNTVAVSNGVFTVSLDFGASSFPGANRFLEISARPSGSASFTLLTPRQPVTSTPYAVRSLNATSADSVPVNGVPSGSGNYIQNTSSSQIANFNITGNGVVGGNLTASGSMGVGASIFLRSPSLQIGASSDAAFTVSPSDGTPNAGYIRFGDKTGWKLHFARSRDSSGGGLNTGTSGLLMTIQDNGNIGIGTASPQAQLDVRGVVKLGSTGQLFATGDEENLRIVRGAVDEANNVDWGSGFSVATTAVTGSVAVFRVITFDTAFSGPPVVTANCRNAPSCFVTISELATGVNNKNKQVGFSVQNINGNFVNAQIEFIAIGPK